MADLGTNMQEDSTRLVPRVTPGCLAMEQLITLHIGLSTLMIGCDRHRWRHLRGHCHICSQLESYLIPR